MLSTSKQPPPQQQQQQQQVEPASPLNQAGFQIVNGQQIANGQHIVNGDYIVTNNQVINFGSANIDLYGLDSVSEESVGQQADDLINSFDENAVQTSLGSLASRSNPQQAVRQAAQHPSSSSSSSSDNSSGSVSGGSQFSGETSSSSDMDDNDHDQRGDEIDEAGDNEEDEEDEGGDEDSYDKDKTMRASPSQLLRFNPATTAPASHTMPLVSLPAPIEHSDSSTVPNAGKGNNPSNARVQAPARLLQPMPSPQAPFTATEQLPQPTVSPISISRFPARTAVATPQPTSQLSHTILKHQHYVNSANNIRVSFPVI
jgi:hypothetical protein